MRYLCVTVCQVLGIISRELYFARGNRSPESLWGSPCGPKSQSDQEETGPPAHSRYSTDRMPFWPSPPPRGQPTWPSGVLCRLFLMAPQQPGLRLTPLPTPPPQDVPRGASVGGPGSEVLGGLSWVHAEAWWARPAPGLPDLHLRLVCWRG